LPLRALYQSAKRAELDRRHPLRGLCRDDGHHPHLRRFKITNDAQVEDTTGHPIPSLYDVGETVGGPFNHNCAMGTELMAGAVFGRIAGSQATTYAKS
jgi:hypothetical protein